MAKFEAAPLLEAAEWFNAPIAPTLSALRGKVVAVRTRIGH